MGTLIMLAALQTSLKAEAYELYSSDKGAVNADFELALGAFHSRKSYAQSSDIKTGSKDWQESYAKYGFSGWFATGDAEPVSYTHLTLPTKA